MSSQLNQTLNFGARSTPIDNEKMGVMILQIHTLIFILFFKAL